jgi:hypothetical protein
MFVAFHVEQEVLVVEVLEKERCCLLRIWKGCLKDWFEEFHVEHEVLVVENAGRVLEAIVWGFHVEQRCWLSKMRMDFLE